ncbi:MAG: SHOCT domain-containing protein [Solirubrobacteraceae bacterium]|jgi:putative oligomerization/nucleic acid binding protein
MPGLLRGVARTAVIAGTATTVSNRVSRRQANRWAEQDQGSPAYMASTEPQQQYAPPQQQYAPPPPQPDRLDQLKELAALKEQGVLSEEEFAAEKARILGS